jgi:hypothetical protein
VKAAEVVQGLGSDLLDGVENGRLDRRFMGLYVSRLLQPFPQNRIALRSVLPPHRHLQRLLRADQDNQLLPPGEGIIGWVS